MKKLIWLLAVVLVSNTMFSQDWHDNFKEAQSKAQESHKPIILVFSGSDWCAPCIKLDKQVFQSDAFKNYANENVVLMRADFPRKKQNALSDEQQKQNRGLAEKYNPNGFFPYVLVLNEKGDILGKMGYEKVKPETYINKLQSFVK
ncbi:thioredoxin family protein [Mangrovimonas spongiae]|uniref:Thioredoxin family protein n=1 Tax=Mangrovimonas spongiae TaxID=2494697 RepID=A0A428K208_9FLAO|nr:thioredoxin family protein [Mangrovimonas spongiae]RSK40462.1 thioredoxin family protein [Mangrovimonas spongiae]